MLCRAEHEKGFIVYGPGVIDRLCSVIVAISWHLIYYVLRLIQALPWYVRILIRSFSVYLSKVIVPRLFEEKRRDTVFGFPWCVVHGAWRVVRGAWRVVRGAWFRIFSRYLVPLTPPTVFVLSFWNFTGALRMVWRYAHGFFQNPEIIFYYFFYIFNLDIFLVLILQKSIGSRYLVPLTPSTVFGQSFWNFTWAFRMAWKYAYGFFRILK